MVGWRVGDTVYLNKWQAMMVYANNPNSFGFYFYDDIWDTLDWTLEPDQDLKTLEIEHCKFLRNKYNLIVLFYSGGVDSHTVLQRFIDAKVHIDYIVCFSYTNSRSHISSLEPGTALNYLKQNQHLFPNTKILSTNESLDEREKIEDLNTIFNFDGDVTKLNSLLRFHPVGNGPKLRREYPEIYKQIEDNNGCMVTGSNKPMVYKNDQGFWYTPIDSHDDSMDASDHMEYFWTGSNPILHLKQCHMVKHWMKANNVNTANDVYKSMDHARFVSINKSFGRELPIDPLFSIKNCHGGMTNAEFFNQEYGMIGQNNVYADLMHSKVYDDRLLNLQKTLIGYHQDPGFKQFLEIKERSIKVTGWLGTSRFLGK